MAPLLPHLQQAQVIADEDLRFWGPRLETDLEHLNRAVRMLGQDWPSDLFRKATFDYQQAALPQGLVRRLLKQNPEWLVIGRQLGKTDLQMASLKALYFPLKSNPQLEQNPDDVRFQQNESYESCTESLVERLDEMARKSYKLGIPELDPVPYPSLEPATERTQKRAIKIKEKPVAQPEFPGAAQTVPPTDAETRMSSVMQGFKQGAMKAAFDKLVDAMAGPLVDKIVPNIKGLGLNTDMLEPAVKLAITFAFMLGIAELTAWIAPMTGKIVPGQNQEDMALKGKKLAEWMRKYAGEKAGTQVIDAAISVFPMIMATFQDFSTADISAALDERSTAQLENQITL